jgi:hypothetical protein
MAGLESTRELSSLQNCQLNMKNRRAWSLQDTRIGKRSAGYQKQPSSSTYQQSVRSHGYQTRRSRTTYFYKQFSQEERTMQSPLLASNSLPSPWDLERAATFLSPGIPLPQILCRMTQLDYSFPASQWDWSRRLTGFNPSSLFNTYLCDSHVLTEYRMGHFTSVVHANFVVNKNVSPSTMVTNIANTWNQCHVKMAAEGNLGLGGLLIVKKFTAC